MCQKKEKKKVWERPSKNYNVPRNPKNPTTKDGFWEGLLLKGAHGKVVYGKMGFLRG